MRLILQMALWALITLCISLVSQSKYYFLAGLVPLFPTFALVAHIFVNQNGGEKALKWTALFGMLSLLPYFTYLFSVYILSEKVSLVWNLTISVFVWIIFALLMLFFWWKFFSY